MERDTVKKLIFSITQFLKNELSSSNSLMEEGAESVEVAVQCLENAYGINESSSNLTTPKELYNIFADYIKNEVNGSNEEFGNLEVSDEDKALAESLKNEGNQLMREEKFQKALECYTKAITTNKKNAVYYCNRAAAHSKLNNHTEAIEDCKKALRIDPQYSKAYGRMGLAYSTINKPYDARECYKKALESEPDNENFRNNLHIAEEKLAESQSNPQATSTNAPPNNASNPFAALGGMGAFGNLASGLGGSGAPDLQGLLSNPSLMNMATQIMSDPNMQNMMSSFLGNVGGAGAVHQSEGSTQPPPPQSGANGGGMEALLNAGRQLAEQLQSQNPELIEQIRNRMGGQGGPNQNQPPS